MKGKIITSQNGLNQVIKGILKSLLEKGLFDAILVPTRVPSGESFVYLLIKDKNLIESCTPLPPIMPIQGARALRELTRLGKTSLKILCVMRPCEVRASVELSKLKQVNLENISFMSIDCPGAFILKDYINDPEKFDKLYQNTLKDWEGENIRPSCNICVRFSHQDTPADIHIGKIGMKENGVIIVPLSTQSNELLSKIDIECTQETTEWQTGIKEKLQKKAENRNKAFSELKGNVSGMENLNNFFSNCINCHNCMRVCPICYCRQCFFDSSDEVRIAAENYFSRAQNKGGIKFPTDMIFFHLGRMSHMGISCIGCGACEDACPMDVPIAQVFEFMADELQKMFNYIPGRDREEQIPVLIYKEDELHEYEDMEDLK